MAGIAAMMRSRKERQRKRNEGIPDEAGFAEVIPGKDAASAAAATAAGALLADKTGGANDKAPSSLKKLGTEPQAAAISKKGVKTLKLEGESLAKTKEQRLVEHLLTESYTPVYMGFVFMSIGLVITFVGLGDKGFRTTELRLIGPSLCFFGLGCILYKILQCHFPRIFVTPYWLKKARLRDTNPDITVERGIVKSIHVSTSVVNTSPAMSPRVILQSAPQVVRPKSTTTVSTIPNYIEDSSDDDFDNGRRAPPRPLAHHQSYDDKKTSEIILDPKALEQ